MRNQEIFEMNLRILNCNYGSRRNYFVELAILEKKLTCNSSILDYENTMYNIIDLQSYYNY